MNRTLKYTLIIVSVCIALFIAYYYLQETSGCPLEGSARQSNLKELNRLKNRTRLPFENDIDRSITLNAILLPGYDRERFSCTKAAEVIGYVYNVKPGGKETCNCEAEELDGRDTHIELVLGEQNVKGRNKVIVEITPSLRKIMATKGKDWSTEALKNTLTGRWVKVQGWLLFDFEHEHQAENTNPEGNRNWRATSWEIHPVTSIEIIEKPVQPD